MAHVSVGTMPKISFVLRDCIEFQLKLTRESSIWPTFMCMFCFIYRDLRKPRQPAKIAGYSDPNNNNNKKKLCFASEGNFFICDAYFPLGKYIPK